MKPAISIALSVSANLRIQAGTDKSRMKTLLTWSSAHPIMIMSEKELDVVYPGIRTQILNCYPRQVNLFGIHNSINYCFF